MKKLRILGVIVMIFILAGCTKKQEAKQPPQVKIEPPKVVQKQPALEVTGIFGDEKSESYAIVDNTVVKVGDKIGVIEVLEIGKDYVEFKDKTNIYKKQLTEITTGVPAKTVTPPPPAPTTPFPQEKQEQVHFEKAKRYEEQANYRGISYEERVELYNKALEEYRLAIYETTGKERDQVNAAIENCKEMVSRLERSAGDREKMSNCNKYASEAKYYRHTRQERIDYANRALDFCTDPLDRETLLRIIREQQKAIDAERYGPQQSDR